MARNDHVESPGADAPSADGLADDLKLLLDQLAVQISDADQRHSDAVHGMQERVAALTDRAAAAKADLPEHHSEAFGRVESAMATLADQLATVEPGEQRDEGDMEDANRALPKDVHDEIRRAMALAQQETANAPPVLRSALTTPTAAGSAAREAAGSKRAFDEAGEEPAADSRAAPASGSFSGRAFDRGWDNPTATPPQRLFRTPFEAPPQSAVPPAPTAATGIDSAWLEARFADIAGRVEHSLGKLDPHNSLLALGERFGQLERRFDAALERLATPAGGDASALQSLEKQITDVVIELGRAQKQLGRLDAIETRLTELRQSPSEQQMAQLVGALSPSDKQLAAIAEAAAERVAERLRPATGSGAGTPATGDAGLGSLTALIQEFIGEQRQGDAQTAEALDTMQLAMQHLIDRVEAIEAAQANGHEELLRATQTTSPRRADRPLEPLEFGVRDTNLTPAAVSSGSGEPRLAAAVPEPAPADDDIADHGRPALIESRYDHDRPAPQRTPAVEASTASETFPLEGPQPLSRPDGEPDREAFIAMARRAADKAARSAPAAPAGGKDAKQASAPGWLPRIAGMSTRGNAAGAARRPRLLLVASFIAFLFAGFWMLTGTGLRGYIAGSISGLSIAPQSGASAPQPARDEAPARSAARASDDATSTATPDAMPDTATTPRSSESRPFPAAGRVADGIGIVVDDSHRTADPARMLRAREQVQMASLSAKLGQDRPPPVTMTSALPAPAAEPARPAPAPVSAMPRSVEMPPAMLGPLSLRHAAANGDPTAQLEIAARFAEGKGVPQDFAQAATWYQRAAMHGHATAQYRLGALYERGLGVPADVARARVWYGRAAEQGNVRAMHNLAVLSAGRAGASPDYPSAIQWFAEAASRGLADSQYNLGILYESGLGVPTSLADAYKWYALAARSGDKDAIRRRDAVRTRLDTASLNAIDKVVIEWRAKPVEAAANDARNAGQIWRAQPSAHAGR